MVSLTQAQHSNVQLTNVESPKVAVFVGATSGIGEAALARLLQTGFPVKVYVVGRSHASFEKLRRLETKNVEMIFLEGQISLMAEAKRLSEEVERREKRLDLLFLSAGFLPFLGRKETSENLELALAVAYYSRQVFIRRLLPLLRESVVSEKSVYCPRVVNILGTGHETNNIFLDDLTLKEPGRFDVLNYGKHASTMTSSTLKRLAEKVENRGIVFIHNHPGVVATELFQKSWGEKWNNGPPGGSGLRPLGNYEKFTPQESGERSLYIITSAKYGAKGVLLQDGMSEGLTVNGTASGSLFCVGDDLETLQLDGVLDGLEKSGAANTIWNQTEDIVNAYL